MRHNSRDVEERIERINAMAAFLALECAHVITKEHFLDF
jgi:hypothetical protein|tara:strand:- start:54 stop:170 length:117 start_codon:yes stop_codon:yes gene_type:complete